MKQAAQASIAESDVAEILGKQVEKAKGGDASAAKFVLGFISQQEPAKPVEKVKIVERVKVIDRGERRKQKGQAPEPARVVEASAPKPTVTSRHMQKLVALHLVANGNVRFEELVTVLEIPTEQLRQILAGDWFIEKQGTWFITSLGRTAVA